MSEPSPAIRSSAGPEVGVPPVIPSRGSWARLRWVWVALALLAATLLGLLFLFNPAEHSFYPFCVFYRVTGLQCPGCGGLRAVHQLLHGHIAAAFQFNQMVVLAAPVVLALLLRRLWRGPGKPPSHRAMALWAWAAFVVLVLFWIVRNLPLEILQPPA